MDDQKNTNMDDTRISGPEAIRKPLGEGSGRPVYPLRTEQSRDRKSLHHNSLCVSKWRIWTYVAARRTPPESSHSRPPGTADFHQNSEFEKIRFRDSPNFMLSNVYYDREPGIIRHKFIAYANPACGLPPRRLHASSGSGMAVCASIHLSADEGRHFQVLWRDRIRPAVIRGGFRPHGAGPFESERFPEGVQASGECIDRRGGGCTAGISLSVRAPG